MKFFRKLSLKLKQLLVVWLSLCGGLLLGACGLASFHLMTGHLPPSRSAQTAVGFIAATIALFLFLTSFVGAAGLSAWLQQLIARPMLDLMRTADSVSRDKKSGVAIRCRDNDELSELLDEFHLMLGQIRAQDAALHEARVMLEARVAERTRELSTEVVERERAEVMLRQQVERMSLINQITRAVAERAELASVFHVLLGHLEDRLGIDFGSACTFTPESGEFVVVAHGPNSGALAAAAGQRIGEPLPLSPSFLTACEHGEIFPIIGDGSSERSPLTQQFARAGLNCALAVPLQAEGKILGALLVGRCAQLEFTAGDANFLKNLGEHVALAARQAQLYAELQNAYRGLHTAQQSALQQERLRALGQIASGIAHDINNALAPVLGFADLLERSETNVSARGVRFLHAITTAAQDIATIVGRMREFYRQREPDEPLVDVQMNMVVQDAMNLSRPRWRDIPQQRGVVIKLNTELDSQLTTVLGNESEIRQALVNLIINAVDAMPQGGELTLRTRQIAAPNANPTLPATSTAQVEVVDTGCGMDIETRRRCLEPFFTTKGARGTGLGLAMVYGVMERQGGRIEIESTPGKGTIMRLVFAPSLPLKLLSPSKVDPAQGSPALRVLCIDDEPLVLEVLQELLQHLGHQTTTALGGQEGLKLFRGCAERHQGFDAVITDLGMPGMDGYSFARQLKSESPSTPVILLTGWGMFLGAEDPVSATVDLILPKPPAVNQLQCGLSAVLQRKAESNSVPNPQTPVASPPPPAHSSSAASIISRDKLIVLLLVLESGILPSVPNRVFSESLLQSSSGKFSSPSPDRFHRSVLTYSPRRLTILPNRRNVEWRIPRRNQNPMKNPALTSSLVLLLSSLLLSARAETFQMVSSLDPAQPPPSGGSGDSSSAVISPDGRFILFASTANNLVLTTNNTPIPSRIPAALNVFLRDRTNNTTALVSVNLSGVAGGNADSLPVEVSPDGRFALFESGASDLTPNDTNNASDVFVRDLVGGTTTLVSISTNGFCGNGASRSSAMTPDGHYVAFVSAANNLVPGDNNRIPDVFRRDLQAGTTVLVSVGAVSTNTSIPGGSSESPSITPDGRYVAFMSTATNLVAGVRAIGDIYVRDLAAGTTTWASSGARAAAFTALQSSNVTCLNAAIGDDGQYVAYEAAKNASTVGVMLRYSLSTGFTDVIHTNAAVTMGPFEEARSLDMTPDGRFIAFVANTNGNSGAYTCICVWDAQSSTINVASVSLNGTVAPGAICDWPTITPDGRFVAFLSSATNLTANPFTGTYHLYVRDTQSGTTSLLDVDTNGFGSAIGPATIPRLSADGRFAAFDSADGNLVPNDRNHDNDIFVRDLVAASTELVSPHDPTLASTSPNGPNSLAPGGISPDGRFIAFASEADNLTPNDTNGCRDIFLRDFALSPPLLVSINTNGFSGHGPSTEPVLSADGRFVAFTSAADDLIPGDTNHAQDVFIHDMQSGTTTLVSVNSNGTGLGNKSSYSPALSSDGRYVLFRSLASNLAPGTFSGENLFLRDLNTGTTYPLTTSGIALSGMLPDTSVIAFIGRAAGSSVTNFYVWSSQSQALVYTNSVDPLASYHSLVLSRDGNRFAYSSLAAGALGGRLYVTDLQAGTNTLIDAATAAIYPGMRFSRDGLVLAFTKNVGTTNQLCLYDLQSAATSVLNESYSPPGMPLGSANSLDISLDARFMVYRSPGTNGLYGASNNIAQLFLYDRQTGTNTLLTTSRSGNASDSLPFAPYFSDDGQTLVFQSWASDLFSQDFNQSSDLFALTFFYMAISPTNAPAQGPRLSWPAVPGNNYRVQFTDKLPDGTWQDLNVTVTNFANKAWLLDPAPATGQRFYRVYSF